MTDEFETQGDRRRGKDRRSDTDRRSGGDRRSGAERRTSKDRRAGWGKVDQERLRGALTAAATVAHLFSQPLTIVIGHVDLLLSKVEDGATRKKLEIIKEQLQSLSMTLQDLRSLRQYKTVDLDGLVLLDIALRKVRKLDWTRNASGRDTTLRDAKKTEILLWDKHSTERELVEEMLTNLGFKVTAVSDEDDCLREFSSRKYDLVIFDQGLPDLDVRRFVDELAEIDQMTPIAMMATLAVEFYEERFGDSNIDFLIVKPFELVQLRRLVEEAVELAERLKWNGWINGGNIYRRRVKTEEVKRWLAMVEYMTK
jgi:two-component system response regulator (stage 0 sporulation protein F)